MNVTPTVLRAHLYAYLDQVLATGDPIHVQRGKGVVELRAVRSAGQGKLARLKRRHGVMDDLADATISPFDQATWKRAQR